MARIRSEILKTLRHPSRILALADRRKRIAFVDARAGGNEWRTEGEFRRRSYGSYDDYVRHQSAKVFLKSDLREYDARFHAALLERLEGDPEIRRGMSVLCVAARIGTEVRAFRDVGCFAVGIDLNPAEGDRFVLRGDFHELAFGDGTTDLVFTNSLDHALDIDRMLAEVHRVLRPDGLFMVEAMRGEAAGKHAGAFESFHWETTEALVGRVEAAGFTLASRVPIEQPWRGDHLRFRRSSASA